MAAARADPLRSTLDNLQLDPRSSADRPYLVAMLRRLGYTEREIEEVVRTGKLPDSAPADDGLAPARDYRLVVPASDSRFALDTTGASAADSPFEDLERVEFEDPANDIVFEEVAPGDELQWEQEQPPEGAPDERAAAAPEGEGGVQWQTTEEPAAAAIEPVEDLGAGEPVAGEEAAQTGFDEAPLDSVGRPDAVGEGATPRTRVRVRRVRAASKEDAERKVAGGGRNVIKSVPVDIVERWGADGVRRDEAKKGGP